jgi:hypothetical protein
MDLSKFEKAFIPVVRWHILFSEKERKEIAESLNLTDEYEVFASDDLGDGIVIKEGKILSRSHEDGSEIKLAKAETAFWEFMLALQHEVPTIEYDEYESAKELKKVKQPLRAGRN